MIGTMISHYNILEKLGEGGMGVVYKAHDTKLDRTVALKFLPSQVGTNDEEKKRFINEAKAASALDHSNICAIHSIDETDDGNLFIVMAYYEGMSLKEKIEQGPLPLKDALQYSIQISSGLQKAHEKGVIHRDLKPENLFITYDDQVKIIDFGLAKAAQRTMLTKSGTTLGTVPYMSPEQAQGSKVDHRTDIWSLGVVMYKMITGQLPFKSEYDTALVYSIVNEDPEPVTGLRSGVPMELERIINKGLEKDSGDRYQQVNELIVDLRKVEKEISSGIRSNVASLSREETTHTSTSDKKVSSDHHPVIQKIQPWIYGIPLILLLLIALYFFLPDRTADPELDSSVAVLPLENLSPDPDDAYFADGVHEDIIIQLSQIGDIRTIARSSVLRYSPEDRDLQEVADDLEVGAVMEGNVRRAGNVIRVAVQLIDPRSDETLWADSYERDDITELFDIQRAIAGEIASALEVSLTPDEQERLDERPTDVTEAYEFYLRGREYLFRPDVLEENFRNAEDLLKRALMFDPDFAHAHALLSRTYSRLKWFGYDTSSRIIELSRQHAERALDLNPNLSESHISMGYYYYHGHRRYDEALEHFNIARRLQPNNAEIISAIGFVKRRQGRLEDSIEIVHRAISLDPMSSWLHWIQGITYSYLREYEKAHSAYEASVSLSPDYNIARIFNAENTIAWKGETETVRTFVENYSHIKREHPADWLWLQFLIQDYEGMIRTVNEVPGDIYRAQIFLLPSSYFLGLAYDYLDEPDRAERYYREALSKMEEIYSDHQNEARYRINLGRIYAALGSENQAIEEGKKAVASLPLSLDAVRGTVHKLDLAFIYAQLQKPEEAVEILQRLLSIPSRLSISRLKVDPSWDPIRDAPEFQRLIQEFEESV